MFIGILFFVASTATMLTFIGIFKWLNGEWCKGILDPAIFIGDDIACEEFLDVYEEMRNEK